MDDANSCAAAVVVEDCAAAAAATVQIIESIGIDSMNLNLTNRLPLPSSRMDYYYLLRLHELLLEQLMLDDYYYS